MACDSGHVYCDRPATAPAQNMHTKRDPDGYRVELIERQAA
jgi:hypothetical protein